MREKQDVKLDAIITDRITPACAGKTKDGSITEAPLEGSPPRVREKLSTLSSTG
ncbi:protein of unknown function [Streptococcus thermophilus]|nr:protein of unknown function [Streptococcus thermophilus]